MATKKISELDAKTSLSGTEELLVNDGGTSKKITAQTFIDQVSIGGGGITEVVQDTTPQLGGTLDANGNIIDMGVNTITDTKVGYWDTAYGWGDHASAGYLTSETYTGTVTSVAATVPTGLTVSGSPITSSGTLAISFDTGYAIPTTASQTNWDTAYGWGDHASAGYLTSVQAGDIDSQTATDGYVLTADGAGNAAWEAVSGGSMVYPGAGIAVSTGTAWGTSLTAPSGTIVGTSDTQTLTNKTITDLVFDGEYTEEVFTISDGASVDLDPSNGTVQLWTLGASRTPTATNFAAGQSITLMIDDGTAYTITWPSVTWVNNGGSAPTLATSGYTVVALWKVSTTLYGALVGDGT